MQIFITNFLTSHPISIFHKTVFPYRIYRNNTNLFNSYQNANVLKNMINLLQIHDYSKMHVYSIKYI